MGYGLSRRPGGILPAIGDRIVPLDWQYPFTVAFILAPRMNDEGIYINKPIGTGFFVHMHRRIGNRYDLGHYVYLVTAAHVVRQDQDQTLVRMNKRGPSPYSGKEGVEDVPISRWFFHDDIGRDVAAAPVRLSPDDYVFKSVGAPRPNRPRQPGKIRLGIGEWASLGDSVYYIGLLRHVHEMGKQNIPLVRSGTLGAMWQDRIPVRLADGTKIYITAHLIDCYSFGGFSGSPCFIYREKMEGRRRLPDRGGLSLLGRDAERVVTAEDFEVKGELTLFGMLGGHFPTTMRRKVLHEEPGYEPEEVGTVEIPENSGVGIVVPGEFIGELIYREDFVRDREERRKCAEKKLAENDEEPAVQDGNGT